MEICEIIKNGILATTFQNLREKQIRISSFDTDHWQFAITPEDKFQDQLKLIQ